MSGATPARFEAQATRAPHDGALSDALARHLAALARRAGANATSVRCVEAAARALSEAIANGQVCVPLGSLAGREASAATLEAVRAALWQSGLACDGRADSAALRPFVVDGAHRLYLGRYYEYERRLAVALTSRVRASARDAPTPPAELRASLTRYFAASPDFGLDWQRVAAALALSGRLTIISGGPGTGKTSTVAGLLACLLERAPNSRIALAAPTGKAAQRMQEALLTRAAALPPKVAAGLPRSAQTLHRLLGAAPGGGFRYARANPLPYDVVVVDEASMIDLALAAHLVDAVAPEARLVLLGDKDQLAAVEAGAVFAELSAHRAFSPARRRFLAEALSLDAAALDGALGADSLRTDAPYALTDCVVWLERNYRFGQNSPIGRLSQAIRAGRALEALAVLQPRPLGERVAALYEDAGATLGETRLTQLAHGFAPYVAALCAALAAARGGAAVAELFAALDVYRILCAQHAGARGVEGVNAAIGAQVRQAAGVATSASAWYPGRPVIVARNDYALGLFNGDIGIALPNEEGALRVWFNARGGAGAADGLPRLRGLSPAALPQHDTAFALTVHMSQGSEFEHTSLVLPSAYHPLLSRELVYTAVTRARRRIDIVGAPSVLAQAIAAPTRRASGLLVRLAELG